MSDSLKLFTWPRGAKAAVSLSFDDARLSQPDVGIPMLDRHGIKATFYVCQSGVEERLNAWRAAVANGHEIGNHTLTHPCTGNFSWSRDNALEDYTLDRIERDMLDANAMIQQLLAVQATTFAYPCGQKFVGRGETQQSYVPLVARHFAVGRDYSNNLTADPCRCDLTAVPGTELDGLNWDLAREIMEGAVRDGRWVVFVAHRVESPGQTCGSIAPDVLDQVCAYCTDPANGIWIDTVAAVGRHVSNQRSL